MKIRILMLLLAFSSLPLAAQQITQLPTPKPQIPNSQAPLEVPYRQFTLANGLNVILHQDKSVPIVAVNIWYHVGSANERPGRTGFAHLFEHLMFGARQGRRVRHAPRIGRRRQQRLDRKR